MTLTMPPFSFDWSLVLSQSRENTVVIIVFFFFKSLTWKVEGIDRCDAFVGLKRMGNARFSTFV